MLESRKTKESGLSWERECKCASSLTLNVSICWELEVLLIGVGDLYILLSKTFLP
jgi:hypothetical protein